MNKKGIVSQLVILLIVGAIIGGIWFLSYNNILPSISTSAIKESCKKNCENANDICKKSCETKNKLNEEAKKVCQKTCESNSEICKKNCKDKNETEIIASMGCQAVGQSCTIGAGDLGTCRKCKIDSECKLQCLILNSECFEPCP